MDPAPHVVPAASLRLPGSRTARFEGRPYGSEVSFFVVDTDPGTGPGLHRHPYSETWVVLGGEATITLGDETVVAHEGDVAVVRAGVWHAFVNTGTDALRMVCVHASDVMVQEDLADA